MPATPITEHQFPDAKRKNLPPAGSPPGERVKEEAKVKFAYDPHRAPVLRFNERITRCRELLDRNSVKTDWEVELAVVIGKKASYIAEKDAHNYIAGYVLHNDYSEREFQLERSGQWVKGKSNDTFAPLGPYLVTPDDIKNPHNLAMWLTVNGEKLQDSNTDDMIFKVPFVIAYLSQFMTLLPGDVISTGTPFGVGLGFKPPRYLKAGDVVELGIEGLGTQRQVAKSWKPLE